ncbi:MAG: hypothetical protein GOV15_04280, partial [Candidatus Diapherotrites archaeon]|nr:hypothetical protein [Candidatus Diapherotrites archaeon]
VEQYYVEKDRVLSDTLSKIGEDTQLIVFSDHGFNSFERAVNINNWLVEKEFMKTKGESNQLLDFVDWKNTQAYSLGFTSIYVNQEGREGQGTVKEDDKESLVKEITKGLKKEKDPKYNKPIITNLYEGQKEYFGPYVDSAPDLVVGFAEGYRMSWKNAVGALDSKTVTDNVNKWKGDHLIDRSHVPGVLFTNFKINTKKPSIMDLAPTITSYFEIKNQNYDGKRLI